MEADHANCDRGRVKISELWHPLPWWERVVYVLAVLLFLLAFFVTELSDHLPDGWTGEMRAVFNLRLPEIGSLLLVACFPFLVAACVLAIRRWQPDIWPDFRRLWSMRAVLVGMSVLFAFSAWDIVIALATPPDRIPPDLPSFLAVPAAIAAGLALVGFVLAAPEAIIRAARAKRQQL